MLTVTTTHDGATSTVTIAGEIDLATSTRVNRELDMALERVPPPARLRVELAEVPYMDTTGVAVLLSESDYVHSMDLIDRLYVIERGVVTTPSAGVARRDGPLMRSTP